MVEAESDCDGDSVIEAQYEKTLRCMVMEQLVESLEDRIERNLRNPREEREEDLNLFARQFLSALRQLHEQGVVHGDIHIGAFMFTSSGELKLVDFGKARRVSADAAAEIRYSINQTDLSWNATDSPLLLSEHELEGRMPVWRDDLLRFAEVLFKVWDRFAMIRVQSVRTSSDPTK
jgi:serine/threonine protein kinase